MPVPTAVATVAPIIAFCSVVMAMALVAAMVVEVWTPPQARTAAVEIVTASPAGAAWTALAERTMESAAAGVVIPRRERRSRSLSSARDTRFCAASSLTQRAKPTDRKSWFLKKRSTSAS